MIQPISQMHRVLKNKLFKILKGVILKHFFHYLNTWLPKTICNASQGVQTARISNPLEDVLEVIIAHFIGL